MAILGKWLSLRGCVICVFTSAVRVRQAPLMWRTCVSAFIVLIHFVRSLWHFKLRSWVRVRFRLFALVVGKANPQLERAVVVPHWKVVHLERLTAGVTGVGDTGAGKFWVISDLWLCGAHLFQTVRGKKPAAIYQMDVQFLSCTCRDRNSDISLTPRHLNTWPWFSPHTLLLWCLTGSKFGANTRPDFLHLSLHKHIFFLRSQSQTALSKTGS